MKILTCREFVKAGGIFMSENQSKDGLSRRSALKIIAGTAGVSMSGPLIKGATVCGAGHHPLVGHTADSAPYVPKFFNAEQMKTIDLLSEVIIPQDEHSPGASAARVYEYIDIIIAKSNKEGKALWVDGLAAMDKMAELAQGKKFRDCTQDQQRALVERISANEDHPATIEDRFFVAIKKATVNGYYTSEIGIHKDLDYQGNDFLLEFKGCQHPEHKS
jgi:hypothetical protein